MKPIVSILASLLLLLASISACGKKSDPIQPRVDVVLTATPTPSSTVTPTATDTPTATSTPTITPTSTPCGAVPQAPVTHYRSVNSTIYGLIAYSMPLTVLAGTISIADLNVYVFLAHPTSNDLIIWLVSPLGASVTLHNRSGGTTNYVATWYDTDVTPSGPGSLADLNCTSSIGVWTLNLLDMDILGSGLFYNWQLEVR